MFGIAEYHLVRSTFGSRQDGFDFDAMCCHRMSVSVSDCVVLTRVLRKAHRQPRGFLELRLSPAQQTAIIIANHSI